MKSYILACSCRNQDKLAVEAFSLIFPGAPIPEIYRGRDRIYKLAMSFPQPQEHIKALSKLGGKYAFYLKVTEDGIIEEEYNLTTGKRIA